MAWLNLTMANQTVKNGLKAKKITLPQMNFFLQKLIKFSCTYWPLSFCKILKKFLGLIQSYEDVSFSGLKWPICREQIIFGTNHYYYFHLPIGPFHCTKFLKNSYRGPRVMRMHYFWAQNSSFAPNNFFFWKKLLISFWSTYWPLSLCKIFKKFLEQIQSYEDVPFSGPKYPSLSWTNFLVQTIIIAFIYLLALFIGQIFKKFLMQIQSYEDAPFLGPK